MIGDWGHRACGRQESTVSESRGCGFVRRAQKRNNPLEYIS